MLICDRCESEMNRYPIFYHCPNCSMVKVRDKDVEKLVEKTRKIEENARRLRAEVKQLSSTLHGRDFDEKD